MGATRWLDATVLGLMSLACVLAYLQPTAELVQETAKTIFRNPKTLHTNPAHPRPRPRAKNPPPPPAHSGAGNQAPSCLSCLSIFLFIECVRQLRPLAYSYAICAIHLTTSLSCLLAGKAPSDLQSLVVLCCFSMYVFGFYRP